ncbi:solute carrier organic anion transporter family member 6A1 [Marmota monax]|uniref:solute carrier organic anion transporter family member 6A1 n=1 Tax=Marmota monax TaxID=9995 RepID=UPI0026EFFCFB|nr:solute carrier organic anion transporter family member 6A1 [Marmota monax]
MKEAVENVELETVSGRRTSKDEEVETLGNRKKISPYLTMLPMAFTKFNRAPRKKKAKSPPKKSPDSDHVKEGPCGIGCIVVPCCEHFNSIRCFLFFFSMLIFTQGIIFGLIDLSTNNFQENYTLRTMQKLALKLSYDVSSCVVAIFVAYYGARGNRPRWVALSSFLIGVGSFLLAYPYLSVEDLHLVEEVSDICNPMKILDACTRSESFQSKYVYFSISGQIVLGIARMPLYILGITFLDDSVPLHSSGFYLGIGDASSTLGYGVGYVMGAPLLRAPKNHNQNTNRTVNNDSDRKWQFIWSIDFFAAGLLAWSAVIPLLCFPHDIPGTAKIKAIKRKQQTHLFGDKLKNKKFGPGIKDLFAAIGILLKNPVFLCKAVSKASEFLVLIGASEFIPIYLENQFIITPRMAATLTGVILIPGCALGQLLGGIIVSKLQMSCKALMRFIIITSLLSIIFLVLIIFVHCHPVQFAGINEDYDGTGQLGNLTAPCNENCRCSSSLYSSVCGRDDIEYFSPCFAGCTDSKMFKNTKTYYNCSCIKAGLTTPDVEGDFIDARPGKCDTKCLTLPVFFALVFSAVVFASFSDVPLTLIIFRVVPGKLHSLALGISYVILRLLGTIPGPVIFKMVGETSCTFRDINHCGRKGRCWIYNRTKMAYLLVGICFLCKVFTICLTTIGFYFFKYFKKENTEVVQPIPVKYINPKKTGKE